ncbi:MAG TPA: PQQ-dependent sugar dehydrogenase [Acidimicrobiia bacterium]|nr:PQQ-dependent sugar dehydrogenase [Acidimicrobiia bacterium]
MKLALASMVVLVGLVGALLTVSAPSGASPRSSSLPAGFQDDVAFSNLDQPTAIAFAPDGRVFVALKSGIIDVFASVHAQHPTQFADLSTLTDDISDRGLLGLAVDPKLGSPAHNAVYALFTLDAPPGGTAPTWGDRCPRPPAPDVDGCVVTGELARIAVNAQGHAGAIKPLITGQWCQQFSSHSIGHLAFGPDGDLYVSGGDGANFIDQIDIGEFGGSLVDTPTPVNPCGDPPGGVGVADSAPTAEGGSLRAQSARRPEGEPVLLNGTVLRVKPLTGAGVPSNPMYDASDPSSNASRIIAYGFRNPFRFTFRPKTKELWVADVGWNTWEEIDRDASVTTKPTPNFGWPCYEGVPENTPFSGLDLCQSLYADQSAPAIAPYDAYSHGSKLGTHDHCRNNAGSVISGIAFTSPKSNYPASYRGALFFGDHSRSCIWVEHAGKNGLPSRATVRTFVDDAQQPAPVDIETDPVSGDLFYVDIDAGAIHRITYSAP